MLQERSGTREIQREKRAKAWFGREESPAGMEAVGVTDGGAGVAAEDAAVPGVAAGIAAAAAAREPLGSVDEQGAIDRRTMGRDM